MNILLAIEDLRTGGAQVFAMRLAQAFHERGHRVYLYTQYGSYTNQTLLTQLAPDVRVLSFNLPIPGLEWLTRKIQGGLRRIKKPFPTREKLVAWHLRRIAEELHIEVLNSHTIKSDYVAANAIATTRPSIPLVITMHGCYEDFLHKTAEPEVIRSARQALQQAAGLVYLTGKNLEIFSDPGVRPLATLPHAQIYNGFSGKFSGQLPTRMQLGIQDQDVVFGMVARGIPEKGWAYAINSFLELSSEFSQIHLVLVGSSDYLDSLRLAHPHPRIHFVGFTPNPVDWVQLFDVGLLPSYFASESLPNSIAEYLFCGVPVVATTIGEIPHMLEVPGQGLAGVLLAQNGQGLVQPEALTEALRYYLLHPAHLAAHKALAELCFAKFSMERCVAAYEELFAAAKLHTHDALPLNAPANYSNV